MWEGAPGRGQGQGYSHWLVPLTPPGVPQKYTLLLLTPSSLSSLPPPAPQLFSTQDEARWIPRAFLGLGEGQRGLEALDASRNLKLNRTWELFLGRKIRSLPIPKGIFYTKKDPFFT